MQQQILSGTHWLQAKPKEYNKETTQQFLAEASLLARKWQDKVESFQGVKHRALELVPELGPSFEEVKEEKAQTEESSKKKKRGQGKTTDAPGGCERTKHLTRGRVKDCGRSLLGPSFLGKELHKF
jgi:hypothetical protein